MAQKLDLSGNDLVIGDVYVGASTAGGSGTLLDFNAAGGMTLAAGTATAAPLTFTLGTNLTTAAAGAIEYDGTVFYASPLASTRELIPAEQRIVAIADIDLVDASIASNTALFAMTGAATGAVTVAAATAYQIEEFGWVTNTGTTSHTWALLFGGTATFTRIATLTQATTSTGAALTAVSQIPATVATATTITAASTSATENVLWKRTGILTINAGGTLIPSIVASARPGASGTPGVTLKAGSYFRITPIGAAANKTIGNWS